MVFVSLVFAIAAAVSILRGIDHLAVVRREKNPHRRGHDLTDAVLLLLFAALLIMVAVLIPTGGQN